MRRKTKIAIIVSFLSFVLCGCLSTEINTIPENTVSAVEEQNGYSFSELLKGKHEYKTIISVVRSNGDKIIYVADQISHDTYCTAHIIEENGEPADSTITLSPGTDFIIEELEE